MTGNFRGFCDEPGGDFYLSEREFPVALSITHKNTQITIDSKRKYRKTKIHNNNL